MTNLHYSDLFPGENFKSPRWMIFLQTEIGKLYQSIPWKELAKLLPERTKEVGAPPWFGAEGYFGLMFLKAYYNGIGDAKLIGLINNSWALQMFCGMQLKENEKIRDEGLPSRVRQYLAEHINIEVLQRVLIEYWKPEMENTHCILNDATVYESHIKYPTDVGLLWDSCVWVFETVYSLCNAIGIRRPRSKYREQEKKQRVYQMSRKKTYKQMQRRKRLLLYLFKKGIGQLESIIKEHQGIAEEILPKKFHERLDVIREVYFQQEYLYEHPGDKVRDRIVSLFKPYIRAIIRGKETKRVEFGMKVMVTEVDGLNWIDKLSFSPYNESTHLKSSIIKHKERFGKCSQIGVDKIYGTNENRKYMKRNKIYHSLVRKGLAGKYEEQEAELRRELGKERSTVLEGSFGNEKNHYGLTKVKARLEKTEVIWVLFGIMTANAMKIVRRRDRLKLQKVA